MMDLTTDIGRFSVLIRYSFSFFKVAKKLSILALSKHLPVPHMLWIALCFARETLKSALV